MARSTFDGPILSGDSRFGPLRDVGYTVLSQQAYLDLTNTTANTAGYAGASTVFVRANTVPNVAATIYTPSTTAYPNAVTTPTADAATAVYRGVVFYLPVGSSIQDIIFDSVQTIATDGTTPAYATYVSNNFATSTGTIATVGSITGGARTAATFSAAQAPVAKSTSSDINQGNGNPSLSQVVVTFAMTAASGITTISAGKVYVTVRYTQPDNNLGSATAYPYGNLD
jgi:hypothetical protein